MAFTYDISTDRGRVRLLIQDKTASKYHFEDAEIDYFLNGSQVNGENNIRLAAAMALRAWAAELARVGLSISTASFSKDTAGRASAMLAAANALEAEEFAVPAAGVAEVAQSDFEAARIILNYELRQG